MEPSSCIQWVEWSGRDKGGYVRTGIHQMPKTSDTTSASGRGDTDHMPSTCRALHMLMRYFHSARHVMVANNPSMNFFFFCLSWGKQMLGHLFTQIRWYQRDKTMHKQTGNLFLVLKYGIQALEICSRNKKNVLGRWPISGQECTTLASRITRTLFAPQGER